MMEGRVSKVEATVEHIETDVGEIKSIMLKTAEQLQELSVNVGTLAHTHEEMEKLRIRQHSLSSELQKVAMAQTLAQRCERRLDLFEPELKLHGEKIATATMHVDDCLHRLEIIEKTIGELKSEQSALKVTNAMMLKGVVALVCLIAAQVVMKVSAVI